MSLVIFSVIEWNHKVGSANYITAAPAHGNVLINFEITKPCQLDMSSFFKVCKQK